MNPCSQMWHVRAVVLRSLLPPPRVRGAPSRHRRGEGFALLGLGAHAVGFGRAVEAVALLEDGARALRDTGTMQYEGWAHGFLAVAYAYQNGREQEALAAFTDALRLLEEVGDAPRQSHLFAFRAAVPARFGDVRAVADDIARAQALAPTSSRYHAWTIDLSSGQLEVNLASRASSAREAKLLLGRARDRLVRATWPSGGTQHTRVWPWGADFYEPRIAAELLERAIAAADAPAGSLIVARDGSSVRLPNGERLAIAGKTKLQRLLVAFVEQRIEHPSEPLAATALFEAGWPGERLQRSSAQNRVHVALDQLRKFGLRELLLRCAGGWHLDPKVPCAWAVSSGVGP